MQITLNWVDLLLLMLAAATLFIGLGLGFYRQAAISAGLAAGLLLAGYATDALAASSYFESMVLSYGAESARSICYLLLLVIPPCLALASFLLFPRLFGTLLRALDTVSGGALGLSTAVVLFWVTMQCASQHPGNWLVAPVKDSFIGSRLARAGCSVAELLPEEFGERVRREFSFAPPVPEQSDSQSS